jgi:cytochrome bd-type quinol oxidase subunit 1
LVDAFRPVTKRIWNAITMLVFLVFCIPVAATSIWLFYEKSYTDSLLTVLFFIFLAFALGQAQGGRR